MVREIITKTFLEPKTSPANGAGMEKSTTSRLQGGYLEGCCWYRSRPLNSGIRGISLDTNTDPLIRGS